MSIIYIKLDQFELFYSTQQSVALTDAAQVAEVQDTLEITVAIDDGKIQLSDVGEYNAYLATLPEKPNPIDTAKIYDWTLTNSYEHLQVILNSGAGYRANSDIPANTAFVEGAGANEFTKIFEVGGAGPNPYLGTYTTLGALQTAHPTSTTGNMADVDAGGGSKAERYIFDAQDGWVKQLGEISEAALLDRANHTGTQTSSTISDFAASVRAVILTGLSFLNKTSIIAGDSILIALGKLQAQINTLKPSKAADAGESTTTGTGWTEKLKLNFTSLASDYKIEWYCEINTTDSGTRVKVKLEQDDATVLAEVDPIPEGSDLVGFGQFSGSVVVTLSEAAHDFDLDFASSTGGKTVKIRNASIIATRLIP